MSLNIFSNGWINKLLNKSLFSTTMFTRTETQIATDTKILWKRKYYGTNILVTGLVPELAFTNLEVGKTYRYSFTGLITAYNASADGYIRMMHNGTSLGILYYIHGTGTPGGAIKLSVSDIFVASNTDITVDVTTLSYSAAVNSISVTIEELPNHEETSQWD